MWEPNQVLVQVRGCNQGLLRHGSMCSSSTPVAKTGPLDTWHDFQTYGPICLKVRRAENFFEWAGICEGVDRLLWCSS